MKPEEPAPAEAAEPAIVWRSQEERADDPMIVSTTTGSEADAATIANALVEAGLAACVHVTRVSSTYRWMGAVESAAEYTVVAKTVRRCVEQTARTIVALHGYDLPELTVTAISGGSAGYLRWIVESTAADA